MDYLSFSFDTQQSNKSERERNEKLTDLFTQMWINKSLPKILQKQPLLNHTKVSNSTKMRFCENH